MDTTALTPRSVVVDPPVGLTTVGQEKPKARKRELRKSDMSFVSVLLGQF